MPVKSYLVFPHPGQKEFLAEALGKIPCCEIIPAENSGVMVLITDTFSKAEEEKCLVEINNIQSLEHLTLVAGFNDDEYAI